MEESMKKVSKFLLSLGIFLIILVVASISLIKIKEYPPSVLANNAAKESTVVSNTIKFQGDDTKPMIIFYPGALVDPKSYSIWAQKVAQAGYSVYIVRFPLDLAILNTNAANKVQNNQPYIIGGHSLGGTMACRYAKNHADKLKGVFLLASYPETKGDLHKINIPVLSVTASRDGVLNQANYQKAKKLLPANTDFEQIAGGNHGGFGSYGLQKGDHKAQISNAKQQNIISLLLINWLNQEISS